MKDYLVTGSAGFIGSNVVDQLLSAGHRVVGVDNLNDAYDPSLKHWRLSQLEGRQNFRFRQADIRHESTMSQLFMEHEFAGVFNLAARAGVRQSLRDPREYVDTNVNGTACLLERCREHDVNQFLLASTSSLYGRSNALPFSEEANTDLPLSPYSASKKGAEAMAASYHHLYGTNIAIPRYFTVYGPGGRPDMSIFRFVKWIAEGTPITLYGSGQQSRDFTFVSDIATGTIKALEVSGLEVINLGGDSPTSIADVIKKLEGLLGHSAKIDHHPFHDADVEATWADTNKAKKLLGWDPKVKLDEGLSRCVAWYHENHDLAMKVDTGAD